jgi:large conductance mechanosensitive channel
MGFIKEFKEFAIKGNVIDLAIAVVLAAAFGKIITAFTESIIAPIIALILGKGGLAEVTFTAGTTVFPIGILLQAIVDFILVTLVLFVIIKGINRMNHEKKAAPVEPELTLSEKLLIEIKDSLKSGNPQS